MDIGIISTTNIKGQIVIPKEYRDKLKIDDSVPINIILTENGLFLYPIKELHATVKEENDYYSILKKTQGAWAGDDWEKTEKRQRKIELKEAIKLKKSSW